MYYQNAYNDERLSELAQSIKYEPFQEPNLFCGVEEEK